MRMVARFIPMVIMVLLVAILSAGPVLAAPGGKGKGGGNNKPSSNTSNITINENPNTIYDTVSFSVSRDIVKKKSDLYSLWVGNKCYVGGNLVSTEYQGVQWPISGDGYAGLFSLNSSRGAECTAYVWKFPSSETPLKDASVTYNVQ